MRINKICRLLTFAACALLFTQCGEKDDPEPEFVFPSKVINKIIVDGNGVKWFATDKGVVSYDGTKWTNYSDNQKLSNGRISDLVLEISTGIRKLWLGSTVGVSSFDFSAKSIVFNNYSKQNSEILANEVSAVGIDKSNAKYIGTSKGLSIFKDGKWSQFYGRENEEVLRDYPITAIASDTDGNVYVTTAGGGVSCLDAVSGPTLYNKPWAGGLPSDTVYCVATDGVGQWFGTNRGAAFHSSKYTKQDWERFYTRNEGLVCDSVNAIVKDSSGNIWFGTPKGVSKLKLSDETWQAFTTKDGLVANKINTIALDTDGSIWVGTDSGISHYSQNKWVNY